MKKIFISLSVLFFTLILNASVKDIKIDAGKKYTTMLFSKEINIIPEKDKLLINSNISDPCMCIFSKADKKYTISLQRSAEISFIPLETKLLKIQTKPLSIGQSGSSAGCFFDPTFLTTDPLGHIYVSDSGNDRVQIIDSNGVYLNQFGSFGVSDLDNDNENEISDSRSDATFNHPSGIAIATEIFVSDRDNHRIMKFDRFGNFLRSFGKYGTDRTEFDTPAGLDMDSLKNLYVADSGNHRIKKYDLNGYMILKFGGYGKAPGRFIRPKCITHDQKDNVYVFDSGNKRIQKFDRTGGFLTLCKLENNIDARKVHDIYSLDGFLLVPDKNSIHVFSSSLKHIGKYILNGPVEIFGIGATDNHIIVSDIISGKIFFIEFELIRIAFKDTEK